MKLVNKLSKKHQKILLIFLIVVLIIELILIGYKVYVKYILVQDEEEIKPVVKEKLVLENENYNYYLSGNATEYQKTLSEELKKVLSEKVVNQEDYATILAKLFISDLFTLNNKENSSDITSSQYVYTDYQETFVTMVKDTIYANIEINLDGKRVQSLPVVTDVEIVSMTRKSFKLNNEVIDEEAFYVTTNISYEKNLKYPIAYEIVIVKNGDLLQVVKAVEV